MAPHERTHHYEQPLDERSTLHVRYRVRSTELVGYAVVLVHEPPGEPPRSVRVYDYTHGVHDEHRCDRKGERGRARQFHHCSVQEGFNTAMRLIRTEYVTMIRAWMEQPT